MTSKESEGERIEKNWKKEGKAKGLTGGINNNNNKKNCFQNFVSNQNGG